MRQPDSCTHLLAVLQHCWWGCCRAAQHVANLQQADVPAQQVGVAQQLPQLTGLQRPAVAQRRGIQQGAGACAAGHSSNKQHTSRAAARRRVTSTLVQVESTTVMRHSTLSHPSYTSQVQHGVSCGPHPCWLRPTPPHTHAPQPTLPVSVIQQPQLCAAPHQEVRHSLVHCCWLRIILQQQI